MKHSFLVAIVLAGAAACSGSTAPPATSTPAAPSSATADAGATEHADLSSKDSKAVAKTLARVSELRGIKSTKAVPGVKLGRDELVGKIKDKALREYPADVLKREGQVLQLLGFAPASFDYLGETLKLLEAQLEGFYEPKNGTMYLASDLHGAQAQATLAHELVHALQDQNWDLKSRSQYRPGHGDETMALATLAEGDATSLMLDFIMPPGKSAVDLPPDMVRELMKSGMNMGNVQSVPHILRTTLVAPYVEGLSFVHELRRRSGWDGVNRAWSRLPTTTEQVLHVEKWEKAEVGLGVPAPTANALGEGWKLEDEDTFGELAFSLMFGEWMGSEDARLTASGWGGDRTATFSRGDALGFAIHLRYDEAPSPKVDALAERAMTKILTGMKKTLGKPAASDASSICFERKDVGPLLVARKKNDVVILVGPAAAGAGSWTSTSKCTDATAWSKEILATAK